MRPLRPLSDIRGGGVLACFAHPDDESLVAGGTLAACAAASLEVVLISATAGESGSSTVPGVRTAEALGAIRSRELRAAGAVLGAVESECLDYPDGNVTWADPAGLRADLATRITRWRPRMVITFGPEGLYWHPDHIAVHQAALDAVEAACSHDLPPLVYGATLPAGLMPELTQAVRAAGCPAELWGLRPEAFGAAREDITTILDVRPFVARKMEALRAHRSQCGPDHLLTSLPPTLADRFLGHEYFIRLRGHAVDDRWLMELASDRAVPVWGTRRQPGPPR